MQRAQPLRYVARAMRLARAALLACTLASLPAEARADDAFPDAPRARFCAVLSTLLAAAPQGFASVRGTPAERRDGVWKATTAVPGGSECLVFGGVVPSYNCDLYSGDVLERAEVAYRETVDLLRQCLPPGFTAGERVTGDSTRTTAARRPGGPTVRVVSGIGSGDAYLVDFWVDSPVP